MRLFFAAIPATIFAVLAACAAPSIGTYPEPLDDGPSDPPSRPAPSASATSKAVVPDGGVRPKGKPTVTVNVTGTGSITSSPAGLLCAGTQCTGAFDVGTTLTLTAVPASGAIFVGWSGQCTGTATCTGAITSDVTFGAEFQSLAGTWTGTYTHTQQSQGCTFNNAGDLTMTASSPSPTTLATTTTVNGLEIRNIPGCDLIDKRQGTASSDLTVANGTISGTWKFAIPNAGTLDLPFTAKLEGKTLKGTWTCNGCTGSFAIAK